MTATVTDIKTIDFFKNLSPEAVLSAYEHKLNVPFPIELVFVVNAKEYTNRGAHAHHKCKQILICLNGKIGLTVDDGKNKTKVTLDDPSKGVYIPAGLWAEQSYEPGSLLLVLADRGYDEKDYIRNYDEFLAMRRAA